MTAGSPDGLPPGDGTPDLHISQLEATPGWSHPKPGADTILELRDVSAGYGRTTVLRNLELVVKPGSVTALLGPNGAGKTTLLRTAAGLIGPSAGRVMIDGTDHTRSRPHERARAGLCLVPEGRGIFPNLSVRENLLLQVPPWRKGVGFESALDAFPILAERLSQRAGSLSGGQQQMLALARCFLADPKVVLLDEVSMGLAPRIIDEIFKALVTLTHSGVALLIVEQYVSRALSVADHVYLIGHGQIGYSGEPEGLNEADLLHQYVGA